MATPDQLEEVRCPLCQGQGTPLHRFDPFEVRRCDACGVLFLSRRLREEAMRRVYQDASYFDRAYAGAGYTEQEHTLRRTFRRFMEGLTRQLPVGGAMLEVGAGTGLFLEQARPHFSSISAIELSGALASARPGSVEVFDRPLEELAFEGRFDYLFALQVIEHVYDPRRFLLAARRALRPGGRIVLTTPDAGSPWRRLMGRRWPSFKVPEHVILYEQASLGRLLSDAGFCGVTSVPAPHAFPLGLLRERAGIKTSLPLLDRWAVWPPRTCLGVVGVNTAG